jgi:glycine/D-amino acid oxidase-like deaminating enzyme
MPPAMPAVLYFEPFKVNKFMIWENAKEGAYWFESMSATPDPAETQLPRRTDVLIIGGGYTGMTAAIRLAQQGTGVTVIDSKPMGTGASARNGGMALNGLSENLAKLIRRHGPELTRRLFEESVAAVDTVEQIVAEGAIDCDFRRSGHFEAAFKPQHFQELQEHQEFLERHFNHATQLVTARELHEEIGSQLYHGGLIDPLCAGLHPARYIAGLIRMAAGLNVGLCEEVTVHAIQRRPDGFEIQTSRGNIRAEKVIVASNGYTGRLTPWMQRRVIPVRSLMIATAPLSPEQARALIPRDRMISDTKIFLYYFRLSPDGRRLLFGGRPQSPRKSLAENARYMRENMLQVYPQLKQVPMEFMWWGKLGFTMDRTPHIGRQGGLYYAMGYCGHGVALATYLGAKLAEMVMDRHAETAFAQPPFRLIPCYNGKPWFLPLVYSYFKFKDRYR